MRSGESAAAAHTYSAYGTNMCQAMMLLSGQFLRFLSHFAASAWICSMLKVQQSEGKGPVASRPASQQASRPASSWQHCN